MQTPRSHSKRRTLLLRSVAAVWFVFVGVGFAQDAKPVLDAGIAPNTKGKTSSIPGGDVEVPELKIAVGLKSADGLLADLEMLVGELAEKPDVFGNKIVDNVEIFLFGVERTLPARFDAILGTDGERRLNLMVPVTDIKEFRNDNVEPIGIDMRNKGSDFYELRGDVYEGWLKFLSGDDATYGVFGTKESPGDVEVTLEQILDRNNELFAEDFDAAVLIDGKSGPNAGRELLVAKLEAAALETLSRRPDETQEAFEFRKLLVTQRFERMSFVLTGAKRIAAGLKNDNATKEGTLKFTVQPLPETPLAEVIAAVGQEPSQFAAVPTIDDPVVTARLSVSVHASRRERLTAALTAARPVSLGRIDSSDVSDALKTGRKELVGLVYDQLLGGLDQPLISGFYEVRAVDGGHQFALGVTTLDGQNVKKIVEAFPAAFEDAAVEPDAATVGELALHKLSLPGMSAELKAHLAGQTDMYIGFTDNALFVTGGPGGNELLAACLKDVEPQKTDVALSVRMHAAPMADLVDAVMTDRGLSLIEFLQERREERVAGEDRDATTVNVGDPAEWRQAAIKALIAKGAGGGDVMTMEIKRVGEDLVGESVLGPALLAAMGELIAKFADENL